MFLSKVCKVSVLFSILVCSQAWATTSIKCTMLNSRPTSDMDDDSLTWDMNGFIPLKVGYGNKGARWMEGSLVKGYWESGKRLWMNIIITGNGKENGNVENRIILKTVATSSGEVLYQGKAFYERGNKSYDVQCINFK